ncbi:amidohydrolase family protein [candidate division KSB1 bacterium]
MYKKLPLFLAFFFASILVSICLFAQGAGYDYDILIKRGKVYDGSGNKEFNADVAVKDGMIVKVEKSIKGTAEKTIDAKGLYVTPGFIDLHTHVDRGMYFTENMPCLNYLFQGVTSVVVGQCGQSAWPIFEQAEDQMKRWKENGIGPNAALLVGHGTVRQIVMGTENRPPIPEELEAMKMFVREAMEQGASGFSTGLIYVPGNYSKTDEVIELVKVIAPYGGIYHTHIRNEAANLIDAINEAIEIGDAAGVPVHISHFKVMGQSNWGSVKEACRLIEEARERGMKITADQYPYQFSNGYPYANMIPQGAWYRGKAEDRLSNDDIDLLFDNLRDKQLIDIYRKVTPYYPISEHHQQYLDSLPRKWLVSLVRQNVLGTGSFRGVENTRERMLFIERLNDPEEMNLIKRYTERYIESIGAENLIIGICVEKEFEGKSLKEIAEIKGKPLSDTAIELELMGAKTIPLRMSEDDIEYIMKKDYVGTGSDGTAPFYGIGLTHIRSYSTFLHKLKKYAQERKAVSVSHVIRSQTSLPAEIMNWNDRGWLKEGYKADINIIDLKNIETKTSISNPQQYCKGVEYLLINGRLVIDKGEYTGARPGDVLKLKSY